MAGEAPTPMPSFSANSSDVLAPHCLFFLAGKKKLIFEASKEIYDDEARLFPHLPHVTTIFNLKFDMYSTCKISIVLLTAKQTALSTQTLTSTS
jgi:hypothetical protein